MDDQMHEWGRMEFRALLRKMHYSIEQRGAFFTLWLAAGLEQQGGALKRRQAEGFVGKALVDFLIAEGDLDEEGPLVRIHGWEVYQNPLERIRAQGRVRVARWREKKSGATDPEGVDPVAPEGEQASTSDVTLPERHATVTPSHSLIVSTKTKSGVTPSPRAHAREGLSEDAPVAIAAKRIAVLTGRQFAFEPTSKSFIALREDVEDFGLPRWMSVAEAIIATKDKKTRFDAPTLIAAVHRTLIPFADTKTTSSAIASEDRLRRSKAEQAREEERRMRLMGVEPSEEALASWKATRDAIRGDTVASGDPGRGASATNGIVPKRPSASALQPSDSIPASDH